MPARCVRCLQRTVNASPTLGLPICVQTGPNWRDTSRGRDVRARRFVGRAPVTAVGFVSLSDSGCTGAEGARISGGWLAECRSQCIKPRALRTSGAAWHNPFHTRGWRRAPRRRYGLTLFISFPSQSTRFFPANQRHRRPTQRERSSSGDVTTVGEAQEKIGRPSDPF